MSQPTTCQELERLTPEERVELARLQRREEKRRAANPLLYFEPRSGAVPFFYDEHVCSVLSGGMRSSKSTSIIARAMMAATGIEPLALQGALALLPKPPVSVRIWCEDMKRTAENVIVPLLRWLAPSGMVDEDNGRGGYNISKGTFRLKNGSFFELMSYDMELQKGASASRTFVLCDEVPPQKLFWSQFMRILDQGGMVWIGATLDEQRAAVGRDPAWVDRVVRRGNRKHFAWFELSTEENIRRIAQESVDRRGPRALQILDQLKEILPPEEYDLMVLGKGGVLSGQVYKCFDERKHTYAIEGMGQEQFIQLARAGYGDIWCGMDHGAGHPTYVAYVFIAKRPLVEAQIVEGDYIQVAEYFRARAHIVHHLPKLQELHRRFLPKGYFCDPHMWNQDKAVRGISDALLYAKPTILKELIRGTPYDQPLEDLMPIGPLRRGNNAIDPGVQAVTALLTPRSEPFPWPRYRLLAGECRHARDGFIEWCVKQGDNLSGEDKYSERMKDQMDAIRYLVMARPERMGEPRQPRIQLPVDVVTGIPLMDLCPLRTL